MFSTRIARALKRIISKTFSEGESVSKSSELKKTTGSWEGGKIAYMIYGHFQSTGAYDTAQGLSDLFSICLQNDTVQDFDTRWDQILWGPSEMPPENVAEGFYKNITRFRTTSNWICKVQSRIDWRSGGTKIEDNGKTTFWSNDEDTHFQSPKWERIETGVLVNCHKCRNEYECQLRKSGRLLSVKGKWTVFERRFL